MKALEKLDILFEVIELYTLHTGYVMKFKVIDAKIILTMGRNWKAEFKSIQEAIDFMLGMYASAKIASEGL